MKTRIKYLSKLVILSLMFATTVFSQSITLTLGTGGVYTIKDASSNFFTLSQSTGQVNILRSLRLENTTSSNLGIIFKGADRFLHNYGVSNTFVGINSGNFTLTGSGNTGVGISSLSSSTTGNYNTAVGRSCLVSNTTGNLNVAIGYSSGSSITKGFNLTCLGSNSQPSTDSAFNQITLGNNNVTSLRCNVQTITSLSDSRDKKNIKDLSLGLDFLMKVKPRLFNWDKREWYENNTSDGSKMKEAPTAGFIAQELDEVQTTENAEWLNLVLKDNPEKFEATSGNLLPVMVKAIQELKAENDLLKVACLTARQESVKLKVACLTARQESVKLKVACLTARQENIELRNKNTEMNQRLSKLEETQNMLVSELEKSKLKSREIREVRVQK